jgi:hypothetical protein
VPAVAVSCTQVDKPKADLWPRGRRRTCRSRSCDDADADATTTTVIAASPRRHRPLVAVTPSILNPYGHSRARWAMRGRGGGHLPHGHRGRGGSRSGERRADGHRRRRATAAPASAVSPPRCRHGGRHRRQAPPPSPPGSRHPPSAITRRRHGCAVDEEEALSSFAGRGGGAEEGVPTGQRAQRAVGVWFG